MQTPAAVPPAEKLLHTVRELTRLFNRPDANNETLQLAEAAPLIKNLVANDDWLPVEMAQEHPQFYQQHLLYGDPLDRFTLVSFVWGPGQATPIHNHTVWGIIGMLRGAELAQRYRLGNGALTPLGAEVRLQPGDIDLVSPTLGDIHRVRNAHTDRTSISIHLYGGNIGQIHRSVFDPQSGVAKPFVSGYANTLSPNLWARR